MLSAMVVPNMANVGICLFYIDKQTNCFRFKKISEGIFIRIFERNKDKILSSRQNPGLEGRAKKKVISDENVSGYNLNPVRPKRPIITR